MSLVHLPATAPVDQAIKSIRENGYVIIDRLASKSEMDRLEGELAPYIEKTSFVHKDDAGRRTKRTGALVARSETARRLIMNDLVLSVCEAIIPKIAKYQLSLTEVISLLPGAKAQPVHRDELGFCAFPFPVDYCPQISTLWAMSEYTEEMGATRIVPGSHTLAPNIIFEQADTVAAEMERGSILIYSGKLYHGGGENKSIKTRQAVNINYAAAWLRQEENQYLATPPSIARTLPHDLLKMMGYEIIHGNLGRVGDWIDPLSLILDRPTMASGEGSDTLMDLYKDKYSNNSL